MTRTPPHPAGDVSDRLVHPPDCGPDPGWGQSLSQGPPGIALLHIERALLGLGDWGTAHAWAAAATRTPVTANPGSSLFYGAPAVAFTLHSADRPGYAGALRTLDDHITTLTRRRLDQAHARINRGRLPALGEYDLIKGLTGIGCYLLHRHPDGAEVRDVLSYLVRLTEPLQADSESLPGWWTGHDPADRVSERFGGGHGNLGIAHGINGPLALLSTAMKRGVTVSGHAEAIGRICVWLDIWRQDSDTGAWWPERVTRDEHRACRIWQKEPLRPSWCYGTPGQARAQQLAGLAIGDTDRQRIAEEALLGCVTDERQLTRLIDVSLCHGWAGLVLTVWRTAADARTDELTARLPYLRTQLIHHRGEPSKVGLLDGDAGVALALHTTALDTPPRSGWDTCLLTNG
ncbi:MAG: lanthionine synthetase C family protein [Pseudonocardiales bacterium]